MKFIISEVSKKSSHYSHPERYIGKEIIAFSKGYPLKMPYNKYVGFMGFVKDSPMPIDVISGCLIAEVDDNWVPIDV